MLSDFYWSKWGTPPLRPPLANEAWLAVSVGWKRAMDSERCEDTSSILNYGLDGKPLRMVSSPNSGPRHTIDNILGLVRKDGELIERSQTPGNTESAGKIHCFWFFSIFLRFFALHSPLPEKICYLQWIYVKFSTYYYTAENRGIVIFIKTYLPINR